ncbi:MAG: DRTGG domain-containing protein [Armatimonadota bacterium]
MLLQQIKKELNFKSLSVESLDSIEVTGGYASDLMSDVLGKAKKGNIWVTNQKHLNVIAVASLLGLSAVIMAGGTELDENALEKAQEENVPLFTTGLSAFEVIGRLYAMGIKGRD